MADPNDLNFGFTGAIPLGASIRKNIEEALQYKRTHTLLQTTEWIFEKFRSNTDRHLPTALTWDYKQQSIDFQDFGNFNYGAVLIAVGFEEQVIHL